MKYLLLVVILAVFATVNSHPLERHARSAEENESETCLTKLTAKQIEEFTKYADSNETDLPTPEVMETFVCVFKTLKIFNEKTGFNVENIVEGFRYLDIDTVKGREIVEKCADKNEEKSTPVEWVIRVLHCMGRNNLLALIDLEHVSKKLDEYFKDSEEAAE